MELPFQHSFTQQLPAEFYSEVPPTPSAGHHVAHVNTSLAKQLGLTDAQLNAPDFSAYFSGSNTLPNTTPFAMVYAGHQFGHYVPQLGDGRALTLGELPTADGTLHDIQLKGAGLTPYSRMGDGRAVLRSSIREYLCSEAMHGLGIPTTRALSLVATTEQIQRETVEPSAVVTRVAESHIRFGHFEYFFYTQQHDALKQLANYVLTRHYPDASHDEDGFAHLFEQAVQRTASTLAQWQSVGFCHGVMNTDNMSILGLTIDYGPFGFLDTYHPNHICNHSDHTGRYAFDQQPTIALWNLMALAQALTPLVPQDRLSAALDGFQSALIDQYSGLMRAKLGLATPHQDDMQLNTDLLTLLEQQSVDYTLFFRALSADTHLEDNPDISALCNNATAINAWRKRYHVRLQAETTTEPQRHTAMKQANPRYILRNYLAENAIQAAYAHHDYSEIATLFDILQRPFDDQPQHSAYAAAPPAWSAKLSVSCSS